MGSKYSASWYYIYMVMHIDAYTCDEADLLS